MYFKSLASWLLLSYFTPFVAFFFAIFWFGLDVWIFLIGMLVVSILTLTLFLKVKDWEMRAYRLLLHTKESMQNRPKVVARPDLALNLEFLQKKASHSVALISNELKCSFESEKMQHEEIVKAYEEERCKLFAEIASLQKLQTVVQEKQALVDEIKSLKYEIETLVGMDQELLREAVR